MIWTIVLAILIAALVVAFTPTILSGLILLVLAVADRPRSGKR